MHQAAPLGFPDTRETNPSQNIINKTNSRPPNGVLKAQENNQPGPPWVGSEELPGSNSPMWSAGVVFAWIRQFAHILVLSKQVITLETEIHGGCVWTRPHPVMRWWKNSRQYPWSYSSRHCHAPGLQMWNSCSQRAKRSYAGTGQSCAQRARSFEPWKSCRWQSNRPARLQCEMSRASLSVPSSSGCTSVSLWWWWFPSFIPETKFWRTLPMV